MARWVKTNFPGVRYRQHPTRKRGVRFDRYFTIRCRIAGKLHEEGLGWASEGWTAQKAVIQLAKLKEVHRLGEGAPTLRERREAEQAKRHQAERKSLTFGALFSGSYFPHAKAGKDPQSWRREEQLFRLWIQPIIGDLPLGRVSPLHLERIKKAMADAGRSPRSVEYALAVVRQAFNFARRNGLFTADPPTRNVSMPKRDNRRLRFLTHEEAGRLLESLAARSPDVHDMALLSLHTGMRAGEIFSLTWGDVDIDRGILTLRDTKSGRTRAAFMTEAVKVMLASKPRGWSDELVFPGRGGAKITSVSNTFDNVVKELGLNAGVKDPRHKVVFHTFRHTYASRLVEAGVHLHAVRELVGHRTLALTERYAHLSDGTLREAVRALEQSTAHRAPGESAKGQPGGS